MEVYEWWWCNGGKTWVVMVVLAVWRKVVTGGSLDLNDDGVW